MEKGELSARKFEGYRTFKSPRGTTFLEGKCGDFTSITLYNIAIVNKPGFVLSVGDIPDELKIKDAKTFSVEYEQDGEFKKDYSITLQVTRDHQERERLSHPLGPLPHPFASVKNEDIIVPKDIWFTFISRGGHRFLGRHVGLFLLVSQYEGIIMNKPGVVVAAVGGIPDELKIEGGISFSFPAPIYKFPFNAHQKIDYEVIEEDMGKEFCSKALMRAFSKAMGVSSICKHEESEDEEAYTDELFPKMIVVNLATPQDIQHLDPSISIVVSQSIPIKKETEEDVGVKRTSEDGEEASIHKKARVGSGSICKQEKE